MKSFNIFFKKMRHRSFVCGTALLCSLTLAAQNAHPAAADSSPTPPMGWNSWNHFAGKVTDADVRAAADELVSSGMRDAGYIYVNIDDAWEGQRNAHGVIQANSKFPDMKALANYVHSKGLKLGIYSSPGPKTCAGYEGSYGHESQDAQTYASWGVDYLKYDLCSFGDVMKKESNGDPQKAFELEKEAYEKMHKALEATGRAIVFSLCQYGDHDVWKWGSDVGGNLWRSTGDIADSYERMSANGFSEAGLSRYAGPGHWNDPDMLEIGNGGMTDDEYRMHMTLWAILAAPLLAGNDLSAMTPQTLALLTNREVIAVDQDKLGRQGDRVQVDGSSEIWTKPLSGGANAVGLFNRSTTPATISLKLSAVGFGSNARLRDLWKHEDVLVKDGVYSVEVPGHGAVMLRISQ